MVFQVREKKDHSPVYCQIAEDLREKIHRGELPPLAQLPVEDDLCGLYGASRITIRGAMKKLKAEGLIHRVSGKGTFVSELKGKQRQVILVLGEGPKQDEHLHSLLVGATVTAQEEGFKALTASNRQLRAFLEDAAADPSLQTGLLFLRTPEVAKEDVAFAEKHGIACLIEGGQRLKNHNWIGIDNTDAMRQVVNHLHGLGRRRFGIFTAARRGWSHFFERFDATVTRLRELGLEPVATATLPLDSEMAAVPYAMTAELFNGRGNPDAIVCMNDLIAAQVVKWLGDHGRKVPDDVAVTGFDNNILARYASPQLTTVGQDYYEFGGEAVRQLRSMMDDFDNKRVQLVRKLELIVRESTVGVTPKHERKETK